MALAPELPLAENNEHSRDACILQDFWVLGTAMVSGGSSLRQQIAAPSLFMTSMVCTGLSAVEECAEDTGLAAMHFYY